MRYAWNEMVSLGCERFEFTTKEILKKIEMQEKKYIFFNHVNLMF